MSFLNKLALGPVFTFLLLTLLILPNISLGATTATLSHNGGSHWTFAENITVSWTSDVSNVSKVRVGLVRYCLSGGGEICGGSYVTGYELCEITPGSRNGSCSYTSGTPLDVDRPSAPRIPPPGTYWIYGSVISNTIGQGASFRTPNFIISAADGCSLTTEVTGSGTITPATNTLWAKNQTKTVTFTPNAGHQIHTATFPQPHGVKPSACIETNGGACIPVATSGTGTLTKTLSCTTGTQYKAKVTFIPVAACPVASQIVSTGGKVTLEPVAPVTTVAPNQTLKVKAESNAGYKIKEFKLRGYDSWFTMSDATGKATSTQTLSCPAGQTKSLGYDVAFEPNANYSITSSSSGVGGSITPLGNTVLAKDKTQKYTIRINEGFAIDELKIDGVLKSEYTGETGAVLSGRDRGQTPKISITLGYINETNNPRTISVKFAPACKFVTPSKTLDNIKKGNQTYINRDNFRMWVGENRTLVEGEFNNYQCAYLNEPTDELAASSLMRSSILGDFTRAKNLNKPALGALLFVGYNNGDYSGHAVVVTGFTSAVAPNPPRTVYSINYIDSNGPAAGILTCRSEYISVTTGGKRQNVISCDIPNKYRTINGFTVRKIYLMSPSNPTGVRNNMLINMSTVRTNPTSWLGVNYTLIDNYGSSDSPQGICLGWSEFNARAAQLVKECVAPPLSLPKTSFNTKEEISFLNQIAVKETLADKYLAQLALLGQIDDIVMKWWRGIVK